MTALRAAGKKVPQDIAIIGFTNTNIADLFNPPLSAIRQPAFDMGQTATELLIQIIESKRPVTEFQTKVLETELFTRESSEKLIS
jgi:LacI family transcriptional regulator